MIQRANGRWVHRDDFVHYLERYADLHGLNVRCGIAVRRIDRHVEGGWLLSTSAGPVGADVVVVATGYDHDPHIPNWPGRRDFGGRLLHATSYRRPDEFVGQDVLVVGSGNSGFEIALDLAEGGSGKVWLSVRSSPIILAHQWLGVPATWFALLGRLAPPSMRDASVRWLQRLMFGDLSAFGLSAAEKGATSLLEGGRLPTIDKGTVGAIQRGDIEVVSGVDRFTADGILLSQGRTLRPQTVIAATAYRRGLEPLVGHLGTLSADGRPRYHAPDRDPRNPGLYFRGYEVPLTGHLSAHLFGARRAAHEIVRYLRADLRRRGRIRSKV